MTHLSSPRRGPSKDQHEAICDAAERLFRQIGYIKTTVADIASVLGMSSANVYRFFPSKSAINDAICRRILDQLQSEIDKICAAPLSAPDKLEAMVLAMHRHHRTHLTDQRQVFDMVSAAIDEHWNSIIEHIKYCEAKIAAIIEEGVVQGVFAAADTQLRAGLFMKCSICAYHPMLIVQGLREQSVGELEMAVQQSVRFLVGALACKPINEQELIHAG